MLRSHLPRAYRVIHQTALSHVANIAGHIMLSLDRGEWLRRLLYASIVTPGTTKPFIVTDPLFSCVVPNRLVDDPGVKIVHIIRDEHEFARSMYRWSRLRPQSFAAHNLIPFWQPHLHPFENLISPSVLRKYALAAGTKNACFTQRYRRNEGYMKIWMDELFAHGTIESIVSEWFGIEIAIADTERSIRTNVSSRQWGRAHRARSEGEK
jgi:hypothetical protein